jgi:hypothetical protein
MAYNDDRGNKKLPEPKLANDRPLNAKPKSTQNRPGINSSYPAEVSLGQGNPLQIGGKGEQPAFRDGGIHTPGKPPGTLSVRPSTQIPAFTSSPFSGRSNMGGGGGAHAMGKGKPYANKKPNNAP